MRFQYMMSIHGSVTSTSMLSRAHLAGTGVPGRLSSTPLSCWIHLSLVAPDMKGFELSKGSKHGERRILCLGSIKVLHLTITEMNEQQ